MKLISVECGRTPFGERSALVKVKACCLMAASFYLNRCWSKPVSWYGISRSQWVNALMLSQSWTYHFLAATKQLYEWYFLCVCPSVRLSVRLSHLFDYVPIIVSSWNFQELSHWTRVRSMQKVKVKGQRSRSQRSRPNFSFPDCNSSLNSYMMMKWYI